MSTHRTLIVFPVYVAQMAGCTALELGARFAWIHTPAGKVKVLRSAFKPAELADTSHTLAFRAAQLARKV